MTKMIEQLIPKVKYLPIGRQADLIFMKKLKLQKILEYGSNKKLVILTSDKLENFRKGLIGQGILLREMKSFKVIDSLFCDEKIHKATCFR